MTTPAPTLEERVTVLEIRLDALLPNLATKTEIAEVKTEIAGVKTEIARLEGKIDAVNERLEGKMDAVNERLEGKMDTMNERMDAMGNRLLIKFVGVTVPIAAIAVAAAKYL